MSQSTIKVISNGFPKEGAKVALRWNGFVNLGITDYHRTDNRGIVVIEHTAEGEAEIYVDGTMLKQTIYTPGEATVNV